MRKGHSSDNETRSLNSRLNEFYFRDLKKKMKVNICGNQIIRFFPTQNKLKLMISFVFLTNSVRYMTAFAADV